jgi:hypothetical protein
MMAFANNESDRQRFDFAGLERERIAAQCVCCGSRRLNSAPALLMPFIADRAFGWEPVVIDDSWGLKTIRNGTAYSICRSLSCDDCGFLFLDIRFSASELENLYRDYRGEAYTRLREHYEPGYTLRNETLNAGADYIDAVEAFLRPHLAGPIVVLDWGGDTGKNTPFRGEAKTVDVFDISSKATLPGVASVDKVEALSKHYSLVVCSNVLEHVPYPSDLLFEIQEAMDEDTILYIEVPFETLIRTNPDMQDLPKKKKYWHEHINFYSRQSLRRLLNNVGFEIVAAETLEVKTGNGAAFFFQLACKLQ